MAWTDTLFQKGTLPVLEAGMGFSYQKHTVIANNIANVETPYYKRQTLPEEEFTSTLAEAIKDRKENHPGEFHPEGKLDLRYQGNYPRMRVFDGKESGPERHDENTVVIEQEMADMAKNQLKMNAMQQLYAKKASGMITNIKKL